MKKIILMAGSKHTKNVLFSQLNEYLGKFAEITAYSEEDEICEILEGDLLVFSSKLYFEEVKDKIKLKSPVVIATRTINYDTIDKLLYLPHGSEVLFVNDAEESTLSCIENLLNLEIKHIKYIPYYPGIKEYKEAEIAVTPGEIDKVPSNISNVIDLGVRPLDMATLIEIMLKLGYYDDRISDVSIKYVKKIIELGKKLANTNNEMKILRGDLERIIIDINRFQIKKEEDLIKQLKLVESIDVEKKDLIKRRYFAKYNFDDILGESEIIEKTKSIAKKLAITDLLVFIEGESGTGKELFASAIHNYSQRKDKAFIAVNFSALTETLVESELFGYEEGAFTGAKKGGRIGIFEQAKGGTIFLDEIGDASMAVQTRLLRVLQEKEIMRIGGDRIIPIDVRIIAATNKNLKELIKEGKFREDLYYRLKLGCITLPPLRERKEDIYSICNNYLKNKKREFHVSKEALNRLFEIEWKGNVRELLNTLEYCCAICDKGAIKEEHLPLELLNFKIGNKTEIISVDKETTIILKAIYDSQHSGQVIGRRMICEILTKEGFQCSEQNIRTKLNNMEKLGLITKSKGKFGTKLTDNGTKYIDKINIQF